MKHFSCQPDSHNAFGSLTNGVLTYFTVDCARYRRVTASGGIGDAAASATPESTGVVTSSAAAGAGGSPSPPASIDATARRAPQQEVHFTTDTRMHVQRTLTLPSPFQTSQCCFSMANRTVFGTDMAFVGAANGLLALAVLQEDLLLYVHGRDPQTLRAQQQQQYQQRQHQQQHTGQVDPSPGPSGGLRSSAGTSPTTPSDGSGVAVRPLPSPANQLAAAAAVASSSPAEARGPHRRAGPSTITWMRDKPLVLVGYNTGLVEWYEVSLSAARRQALRDPAKEVPYGASVTPSAFAYQALNRDTHTSRVAHVAVGATAAGLLVELVATCTLPDAGALVSSDYFPANGTVAVVGERGGLVLFSTDQLASPLCEVRLNTPAATFLYCHPVLPLVGVLAQSTWSTTAAAVERRPPRDRSPTLRGGGDGAVGAGAADRRGAAGSRQPRRVGWHDGGSGGHVDAGPAANATGGGSGSGGGAAAVHTGCVLTLVEYRKAPPPPQLSRAWAGTQPPPPSHRLTQVLHHRLEGVSPRYGTYYTFSWKFSFDLELAVGNLEEGAVRVVRAARTADQESGAAAPGVEEPASTAAAAAAAVADGERSVPTPAAAHSAAAYVVVQDYRVRLPLHSLANIEYVSAATSSLGAMASTAAASSGTTGGAAAAAEWSLTSGEASRSQRQAALLSAAVHPRYRLGYSSVSSVHDGTAAAGALCRPVNALWSGLAVVSMPTGAGHGGHCSHGGGGGGVDRHGDPLDFVGETGESREALDILALRTGAATAGGADGGGPQLKENALAAAMLQPLRENGGGGGGGARRRRRHGGETSVNSSRAPGGGSGAGGSSSRWLSSSTTTSVSTQQPSQPSWRAHQHRGHRDPRAPAVEVPSYAMKSTKNEIANAVLIAADRRADLHDRLRIGPGAVSCVVGMNAAGEVASVPIEVRAVSAWHEEGSVFVSLGPTLCAADLVSIQGTERLMRRRHAAGFGVSSLANLAAVRKVGGFGSEDVAMLFTYVATLEAVSLVAASGPVPSLMELLRGTARSGRGALRRESATRLQARLGPTWRATAEACVCHDDLCCLLVLQVLRWLPASCRDGEEGADAPWQSVLQLPSPLADAAPALSEGSTNAEVERAVAVEVTHRRFGAAAELLLRYSSRSPNYRAMATLLQRPEEAQAMVRHSDASVCASFCDSLTPWLLVVFYCLCGPVASRSPPPAVRTALPVHLYQHSALAFWDRVALALLMEGSSPAVLHHVLQAVLLPQCTVMQAVLLHHGIHLRTCAAMQEIVDCTGDFQLGACLYARVGVLTSAAALAFPFLLDAEVSAAVAAAAVSTSQAAHSHIAALGLRGAPELLKRVVGPALYGDDYYNGDDDDEDCDAAGWDEDDAAHERGDARGGSPFAFLLSRRRHRRRSVAASSSTAPGDPDGSLEDGVAHTARLVRNSALPPPAPMPGEVNGVARSPHTTWAAAAAVDSSYRDGGSSSSSGGGEEEEEEEDEQGDEADVPWVWWAAAYRSFLDDEQAFVCRTTFDVECQQLRGRACLLRDAVMASPTYAGGGAVLASIAGVARGGRHGSLRHQLHRTALREAELSVRRRHSSSSVSASASSPEDLVAMAVAQRAARRAAGAGGVHHFAAATSSASVSILSPFADLYGVDRGVMGLRGGGSGGDGGAAAVASAIHGYAPAAELTQCVCGERHTGTQLVRALLNLSSTTTTRCSVCLMPVRLGTTDVATAFAWCTSCGHGGHVHHLQDWFRTHRRCPVDGCDCHCDEDSSLY